MEMFDSQSKWDHEEDCQAPKKDYSIINKLKE